MSVPCLKKMEELTEKIMLKIFSVFAMFGENIAALLPVSFHFD